MKKTCSHCERYLGFDDRWLMIIGIPILSLMMPILLNLKSDAQNAYWTHMVPESFIYVLGFWLTYRYVLIGLYRRYPRFDQTKKRVMTEVAVILLTAPIVKYLLEGITHALMTYCHIVDHIMPDTLTTLLVIYLPSGLIVAIYDAFYFFNKYRESIIEKEKLEKMHIQSQLDNLRNQINPHFLFNSLNTLMNLIPTDPDKAMTYLSKLSKFYRYTVNVKEEKLVCLTKELKCAELYGDLLSERFHTGINIKYPSTYSEQYLVPPMSLQLLIENAVKHNIVSRHQPLQIDISVDTETAYIIVQNNLQNKMEAVSSTGMGLKNIKERYSYFTNREMICEKTDHTFVVRLPLLNIKDYEGTHHRG